MNQSKVLLESMVYIEAHLKEPLDIETISAQAGYSVFYFSRLFRRDAGVSVMEYVKKRRLLKASDRILHGERILDTALDYGYQSHGGFAKAFKREFGFSPAFLRGVSFQMNDRKGGNVMSHAFLQVPDVHQSKEELYQRLVAEIKKGNLIHDLDNIQKAYAFACRAHQGQKRYSGDDYVTHPINIAILLAEMECDEDIIIAGLLCEVLSKTDIQRERIEEEFPGHIGYILKMVKDCPPEKLGVAEWEATLIVLAKRLHNMRTIEYMAEGELKRRAIETAAYFPLASQINNDKLTAELQDLVMKYIP